MTIKVNKKSIFVLLCIIVSIFVLVGCSKEEDEIKSQDEEVVNKIQDTTESNEKLVQAILKESGLTKENNNRYTYFNVNLKGMQSENEVITYLWGDDFSSTGGGTIMIFENINGEYNFISKITGVNFPIYIVQEQSDGLYDLVVTSSGEEATTKTTLLKYQNGKYTLNPSAAEEINVDDAVILRTLQYEVKSDGGFELK